jgi:hypothetical protein
MNEKMDKYNSRQIRLMEEKIHLFKEGDLTLYDLLSDLTGLLNCITDCDANLFSQFQSQLGTLDTVYANKVYENRTVLTDLENSLVITALQKIETLIESYNRVSHE